MDASPSTPPPPPPPATIATAAVVASHSRRVPVMRINLGGSGSEKTMTTMTTMTSLPRGRSALGLLAEERAAFEKEREEWGREQVRLRARVAYTREAMMKRLQRMGLELIIVKTEERRRRKVEGRMREAFRRWRRMTGLLAGRQGVGNRREKDDLVRALFEEREVLIQRLRETRERLQDIKGELIGDTEGQR